MIEGNFKDASLPGLLQFLATESTKLYRVKLTTSGNSGEVFVQNGNVISAKFNLLDGEDAMCEFLSWRDGAFSVERLPGEFETTINKNINLRLQGPTTFVSQSNFLVESSVGLNTIIVPCKKFGGLEWQDALRTQPLEREDFLVVAWLKEGRTMREACREFGFDIVKSIAILYRLLLTHSVEAKRPTASGELESESIASGEPLYQLSLSTSGSPEINMVAVPTSERRKASKAIPVNLAGLRASMEARLRASEPMAPAAAETTPTEGEGIAVVPTAPAAMPDIAAVSGPYDTTMVSAVSSTLSALGAALNTKLRAAGESEKEQSESSKVAVTPPGETDAPIQPGITIDCAPDAVSDELPTAPAGEEQVFSGRRTDAIPLVTIDIERLLQATFTVTQFGKLALTNHALDPHIRQTLLDVKSGKTLVPTIGEAARSAASILSTYRFCLARGYIISTDPVLALTADLLLGRMELDQYLLQRRRINGDELRDLIEIERQKGIKLCELLVRHGYLTAGDLERLLTEQKRFALK